MDWKFDKTLLELGDFKEHVIKATMETAEINQNTCETLKWEIIKSGSRGVSYGTKLGNKLNKCSIALLDEQPNLTRELVTCRQLAMKRLNSNSWMV